MNTINKFIHHVIDAFHSELPQPKRERCVFVSRDYTQVVLRMCESEGTLFIREHKWADGKTTYFLIQL